MINDIPYSFLSGVGHLFRGYDGAFPDGFYLSSNVCPRQLNALNVTEAVMRFLRKFEGRIGIVLEIVERGTMLRDDFTLETMQQHY